MANPIQIKSSMTWDNFNKACIDGLKSQNVEKGPLFAINTLRTMISQESSFRFAFQSLLTNPTLIFPQENLQNLADELWGKWQKDQKEISSIKLGQSEQHSESNGICKNLNTAATVVVGLAAFAFGFYARSQQ